MQIRLIRGPSPNLSDCSRSQHSVTHVKETFNWESKMAPLTWCIHQNGKKWSCEGRRLKHTFTRNNLEMISMKMLDLLKDLQQKYGDLRGLKERE